MGSLTTHVLDTYHGVAAANVAVELTRLDGARESIVRTTTNADGRCGAPLLSGAGMKAGRYELAFDLGAYFRGKGVALPDPPFLSKVVIHIGIADAAQNYHVPLLASPWSYSTYRGS
jgi:5-hydroxyisourate hydrolase